MRCIKMRGKKTIGYMVTDSIDQRKLIMPEEGILTENKPMCAQETQPGVRNLRFLVSLKVRMEGGTEERNHRKVWIGGVQTHKCPIVIAR